jgi:hypothetical protein
MIRPPAGGTAYARVHPQNALSRGSRSSSSGHSPLRAFGNLCLVRFLCIVVPGVRVAPTVQATRHMPAPSVVMVSLLLLLVLLGQPTAYQQVTEQSACVSSYLPAPWPEHNIPLLVPYNCSKP